MTTSTACACSWAGWSTSYRVTPPPSMGIDSPSTLQGGRRDTWAGAGRSRDSGPGGGAAPTLALWEEPPGPLGVDPISSFPGPLALETEMSPAPFRMLTGQLLHGAPWALVDGRARRGSLEPENQSWG